MFPTLTVCAAAQVEAYLEAFAKEYGLHRHIHYATRVVEVLPQGPEGAAQVRAANGDVNGTGAEPGGAPWPRWQVTTEPADKQVIPQTPLGLNRLCSTAITILAKLPTLDCIHSIWQMLVQEASRPWRS